MRSLSSSRKLAIVASVALVAAGCGTNISPDTTLGELLNQSGLAQRTIGQLIGDLQAGLASFENRPGRPFFPGGPQPDPLNLTDDQRAAADDIFSRMHSDIESLYQSARDQIQAVLTDDQRKTLE